MNEGFLKWAERYCLLFGIASAEGKRAIMALEPVYRAAGFTTEELEAATDRLAGVLTNPEPGAHRVAIRDAVLHARAAEQEKFSRQYENSGRVCAVCGNAGCVVVPHHRSVAEGSWDGSATFGIRYTAGVCCSCVLGERRYAASGQATKDGRTLPKLMRLADYERVNPRWGDQLRSMASEEAAAAHADRLAGSVRKGEAGRPKRPKPAAEKPAADGGAGPAPGGGRGEGQP